MPIRAVLQAQLASRGLVILSDVHYPGWNAAVDGRPAQIHEAYGLVRAVEAPAGLHEIVFEYRPRSVVAGLALTGAGLLAALFAALRSRRAAGRV
jgi:uncharacterized membrane protein YfhO